MSDPLSDGVRDQVEFGDGACVGEANVGSSITVLVGSARKKCKLGRGISEEEAVKVVAD